MAACASNVGSTRTAAQNSRISKIKSGVLPETGSVIAEVPFLSCNDGKCGQVSSLFTQFSFFILHATAWRRESNCPVPQPYDLLQTRCPFVPRAGDPAHRDHIPPCANCTTFFLAASPGLILRH